MLARVISVVEFPRVGYKIKKVFGYKSIFQKNIIIFCEQRIVKKCKNLTFKVYFDVKNAGIFPFFFIEKYKFRRTFFGFNIF